MQDSASKSHLLLICPRPFSEGVETSKEVGEAAIYGSAAHEALEATIHARSLEGIAKKWGIEDEASLLKHVAEAHEALRKWLRGGNPWGEKFSILSTERPMATRILSTFPLRVRSRECAFDGETHTYDLRKGEFGGTADLVAESAQRRLVLDYKFGDWDADAFGGMFHTPSTLPQLLTLALQHSASAVAVLHAPRESVVSIYADDVDAHQLSTFARQRRRAAKRVGSGFLRPGPHCARCPAYEGCPANDGQLIARAASIVKVALGSGAMQTPVDKGAFHMFLGELDKLERRARAVLKEDVKRGEIIARPDGKVLVIREKEYETLSKSSVVAALGKQKGEAMIAKLRELGCVPKDTREELHAVEEGR